MGFLKNLMDSIIGTSSTPKRKGNWHGGVYLMEPKGPPPPPPKPNVKRIVSDGTRSVEDLINEKCPYNAPKTRDVLYARQKDGSIYRVMYEVDLSSYTLYKDHPDVQEFFIVTGTYKGEVIMEKEVFNYILVLVAMMMGTVIPIAVLAVISLQRLFMQSGLFNEYVWIVVTYLIVSASLIVIGAEMFSRLHKKFIIVERPKDDGGDQNG